MKSGKFVTLSGTSDEQETNVLHEIELRQGDCVEVVFERNISEKHTGEITELIYRKYRAKCLCKSECDKWWNLESEHNAVWYHQSAIIGQPTNKPKMYRCVVLKIIKLLCCFIKCFYYFFQY